MPHKGISDDLKSCIPVLFHGGFSVKDICHLLGIKNTLVDICVQWLATMLSVLPTVLL
ncbi:hypothetical protein V8B97DRAFT_1988675, partial [Scleroderma yunnanense]